MRVACTRGRALALDLLLAGMLLASSPCAFALNPSLDVSQYAHTAWKIREGFSKGAIYAIAQTPDGYLWLGTEFGCFASMASGASPGNPLPVSISLPTVFTACSQRETARSGLGLPKGLQAGRMTS